MKWQTRYFVIDDHPTNPCRYSRVDKEGRVINEKKFVTIPLQAVSTVERASQVDARLLSSPSPSPNPKLNPSPGPSPNPNPIPTLALTRSLTPHPSPLTTPLTPAPTLIWQVEVHLDSPDQTYKFRIPGADTDEAAAGAKAQVWFDRFVVKIDQVRREANTPLQLAGEEEDDEGHEAWDHPPEGGFGKFVFYAT